ncbi:hypothetical protein B0T18DRAFT_393167 [Schizothecium vesticola]|uniref:Uncharacterized protein n=1 Tax=Schizothecium vesticola TaxID=314040 RepID=A0AA40EJ74_9PEZI|nr:hypothetical protein B0T18DRAFT_393167 [Schizothecium vesticola]
MVYTGRRIKSTVRDGNWKSGIRRESQLGCSLVGRYRSSTSFRRLSRAKPGPEAVHLKTEDVDYGPEPSVSEPALASNSTPRSPSFFKLVPSPHFQMNPAAFSNTTPVSSSMPVPFPSYVSESVSTYVPTLTAVSHPSSVFNPGQSQQESFISRVHAAENAARSAEQRAHAAEQEVRILQKDNARLRVEMKSLKAGMEAVRPISTDISTLRGVVDTFDSRLSKQEASMIKRDELDGTWKAKMTAVLSGLIRFFATMAWHKI